MKYWLWRLLGKRYWMELNSHYKDGKNNEKYTEWEQKKDEIRNHRLYQLVLT